MPGDKHKTDEMAIRRLDEEWGKAATAKDLEAVVSFYAPDGSLVWPGAPASHGTQHIRASWKEMMDTTPGLNLRFTPERIVISDDASLASDFGKVEFGHEVKGKPVMDIAKYVVVWRKEKGSWKVLYDSYNVNS
ncbi:SgcJ/EcaC family oxidoreductase [Nordella sp. HKS 07]|uniref:YybH family protein n=1 Tax=Nordella sp. HKS 07 TaxID=2712222 RepID=UPI0013E1434A|nr:SgcJ/EcaC family oxidoreductase [Nordella sp. HKS 07]QIG49241.1 SgcJ/EcaC family oxidoreductase [Nordella sp. HKS 07]